MKILNSCTNKKIELKNNLVTIYNCGPTVYNHVHIGNVRPLIIFDVLHRYLLACGKKVKYIQNITDIDDKIIKAAKRKGISENQLSIKYIKAYKNLFNLLNVKQLIMPCVSDNIQDIQNYISNLIDKKAAYIANGDVYFNINKIKNYGHISHQDINELKLNVRKVNKCNKHNPLDFVLWKKTNEGINWDSPWSKGRPGWHTECCALISKYFGDHVTIHGGGVDLKFPHHENENAQNLATYKRDIADIWMHIGHITINGSKMSKSLNNFILVNDLITSNNANGLRWFFYQTKYQHPINFSYELFNDAIKFVNNIIYKLSIAKTNLIANNCFKIYDVKLNNDFKCAFDDDLNLPNAISVINAQLNKTSEYIKHKKWKELNLLLLEISNELDILGIKYDNHIHNKHKNNIIKWKQAIDKKDYKIADKIRRELIKEKIL